MVDSKTKTIDIEPMNVTLVDWMLDSLIDNPQGEGAKGLRDEFKRMAEVCDAVRQAQKKNKIFVSYPLRKDLDKGKHSRVYTYDLNEKILSFEEILNSEEEE